MASITIDPNYGYVLLAATSTFIMNFLHIVNTGAYRKAAKINYPAAYAPSSRTDTEAHRFNCAQRAHANFIENQVTTVAALILAGIKFPLVSAGLGLAWSLTRYIYMVGYSQGGEGGKGRYKGIYFWVFQSGLIVLAGYNGAAMIMGW